MVGGDPYSAGRGCLKVRCYCFLPSLLLLLLLLDFPTSFSGRWYFFSIVNLFRPANLINLNFIMLCEVYFVLDYMHFLFLIVALYEFCFCFFFQLLYDHLLLYCGWLMGPHEPGDGLGGGGLFCFFKAHSCLSTIKAVTYIASAFASIPDLLLLLLRLNVSGRWYFFSCKSSVCASFKLLLLFIDLLDIDCYILCMFLFQRSVICPRKCC